MFVSILMTLVSVVTMVALITDGRDGFDNKMTVVTVGLCCPCFLEVSKKKIPWRLWWPLDECDGRDSLEDSNFL